MCWWRETTRSHDLENMLTSKGPERLRDEGGSCTVKGIQKTKQGLELWPFYQKAF